MGSIEDELRRVVAKEALAHVHDRLDRRGLGSLIDNRPDMLDQPNSGNADDVHISECCSSSCVTHQTSCLWPATLAAGLKGSFTMFVPANPLSPMVLLLRICLESERGRRLVVVNRRFSMINGARYRAVAGFLALRERDRFARHLLNRYRLIK
jgi:hypothetical protein